MVFRSALIQDAFRHLPVLWPANCRPQGTERIGCWQFLKHPVLFHSIPVKLILDDEWDYDRKFTADRVAAPKQCSFILAHWRVQGADFLGRGNGFAQSRDRLRSDPLGIALRFVLNRSINPNQLRGVFCCLYNLIIRLLLMLILHSAPQKGKRHISFEEDYGAWCPHSLEAEFNWQSLEVISESICSDPDLSEKCAA